MCFLYVLDIGKRFLFLKNVSGLGKKSLFEAFSLEKGYSLVLKVNVF